MKKTLLVVTGALLVFAAVLWLPAVVGDLTGLDAGLDFERAMAGSSLFIALGVVFLGGVLTSLTPCVYPLIPITVAVFGARDAGSRLKGAGLSSIYVLGMAVMYSALGLGAALTGKAFGGVMANPWVIGTVALVFVVFAASMLGAFEMNLPPSVATRLSQVGGQGYVGAFGMGLVSGIVAAPCTGPVLGGVLTYVATTQDVALGLGLLFTFAVGMGLLFFVIGTFSVSLPKSGTWMDVVKSVFAVAMLVVALYFLKDVIPWLRELLVRDDAVAWITAVVAALGVLLGGIHLTFHGGWGERALKGAGLVLLVGAVFYRAGSLTVVSAAEASAVAWLHDEPAALTLAEQEDRPVMIDFRADWCAACVELERKTYPDPAVSTEAQRFVNVKIDATDDSDPEIKRLFEKYRVHGLPLVVFIGSDGAVREDLRVTGFIGPPAMLERMESVR